MKQIGIFGASGSIGRNALKVIAEYPDRFRVAFMSVHTQVDFAVEKALEIRPKAVAITGSEDVLHAMSVLEKKGIKVFTGDQGLANILESCEYDLLVNALVGGIGLIPTLTAIEAGKTVALANKESLVMAGGLVNEAIREHNGILIPIDSEHSAIFQCLVGEEENTVDKIVLTGSGGPFLNRKPGEFANVTIEEALAHPNWKMGKKITIDSATMMNKGLEIIEAHWLFGLPLEAIDLVIHPQSIVHSMVKFKDGSFKAQLGWPDMKVPIQYSLTFPDRLPLYSKDLDFAEIQQLTFQKPDFERFPNLKLAIDSIKEGGTAPAVLNAVNEEAVYLFLDGVIPFNLIPILIEEALNNHDCKQNPGLEAILASDQWARNYIYEKIRMQKTGML